MNKSTDKPKTREQTHEERHDQLTEQYKDQSTASMFRRVHGINAEKDQLDAELHEIYYVIGSRMKEKKA